MYISVHMIYLKSSIRWCYISLPNNLIYSISLFFRPFFVSFQSCFQIFSILPSITFKLFSMFCATKLSTTDNIHSLQSILQIISLYINVNENFISHRQPQALHRQINLLYYYSFNFFTVIILLSL